MSVRIRLARVGKKGHPSYRIVVAEATAPRDGSYLEWIGNYDPMKNPPAVTLKQDRAAHWLKMGALPSDAVARILDQQGLMERAHKFKNRDQVAAEEDTTAAPTAVAAAPAEAPADEEPVEEATDDGATVDEDPVEEAPADESSAEEEASEE